MAVTRVEPPFHGDERETLAGFLDFHRATLMRKCEGLSDDQLRTPALPPSNLSLIGLVRHLAEVERAWFRSRLTSEVSQGIWITEDDPDADFDGAGTADVPEAMAAWHEQCARSREILSGVHSLEDTFTMDPYGEVSVRWLLVHMVEEYARHVGHADLIRERLDGTTGV